jgi:hypothetical protein
MMNNDEAMKVFTNAYLQKLKDAARSNIAEYINGKLDIEGAGIVSTKIKLPRDTPVLEISPASDAANAIKVYEYLSALDDTSACDERVWSYMTHVPFRNHMIGRWPIQPDVDNEKAIISVNDHWFYGQRGLVRNGIARLWWGVRASVAPWEDTSDSDFYQNIDKSDRYRYTKLLFSKSVIYQQIMEREQTRSPRVKTVLFEYIYDNQDITKEQINIIAKRIDMSSSYKKLNALDYKQLREMINSFAGQA